jgi:hypothetical protein
MAPERGFCFWVGFENAAEVTQNTNLSFASTGAEIFEV